MAREELSQMEQGSRIDEGMETRLIVDLRMFVIKNKEQNTAVRERQIAHRNADEARDAPKLKRQSLVAERQHVIQEGDAQICGKC